jgi:hypothetical protein
MPKGCSLEYAKAPDDPEVLAAVECHFDLMDVVPCSQWENAIAKEHRSPIRRIHSLSVMFVSVSV